MRTTTRGMAAVLGLAVMAATCARGADIEAVLDSSDGSSAFNVLDSTDKSVMRVGSDGVVKLNSGAGNDLVISGSGTNVAVGQGASAAGAAVAVGLRANAAYDSVAVGCEANGRNSGAAVGDEANAYNFGAALGGNANGSSGVAVGFNANGRGGTAVGQSSIATNLGVAVGTGANGASEGAAVGVEANALSLGAALGFQANAAYSGVAVGHGSTGSMSSVAIGSKANAGNFGAAIGDHAEGSSGAAVGKDANGQGGAAMGSSANGASYGVGVGRSANGYNRGVAVGYYATGRATNVAIGMYANASSGNNRIAIGEGVTNNVNNSAALRGNLYLDGTDGQIRHRATFGQGAWSTKAFVIDHPLDPQNRVLRHFCLEGPDVWNVYAGNAQLVNGAALVELPNYYGALNLAGSEVYSLTPVGRAQVWVEREVAGNRFVIGGDRDVKVSWTLKVLRNDPACAADLQARPVEQLKSDLAPGQAEAENASANTRAVTPR